MISKVKVTAGEVADKLPLYLKKSIEAMKQEVNHNPKQISIIKSLKSKNAKLLEFELPVRERNPYQKFLSEIKDNRIKDFYKLAQLIFASDRGRRGREFGAFEKNLNVMIASALDLANSEKEISLDRTIGKTSIGICDSRSLRLKDATIDGIITSPPYSIALNYMENDRYALDELGIDIAKLSEQCVGVKGKGKTKCELYERDMEESYSEIYRVLKEGKYAVVVIGEAKVDGKSTNSVEHAIDYCESIGFKLTENLRKNIFGLYNTITEERVLFLRKT